MLPDDPNLKPQYRMPRVFGALPGPRNVPKNKQGLRNNQTNTTVSVTALTDAAALAGLLPPDCELDGPPRLTINCTYLDNIGWMGGHAYNIVSVGFRIAHHSPTQGRLTGNFLPVLWENLTDPIITGREELGWSKLYAEIPPARIVGDGYECQALWQGFRFLDLQAGGLDADGAAPEPLGQFHYKFIPNTGDQGRADVEYLEYAPPGQLATGYGGLRLVSRRTGQGRFRFNPARWEDMPFQYPIINALAALPTLAFQEASVTVMACDGPIGDVSAGVLKKVD